MRRRSEATKAKDRERKRLWHLKNKERLNAKSRAYYQAHKERWVKYDKERPKDPEYHRAYYEKHKDRIAAKSKAYYAANRERFIAWSARRYRTMTAAERERLKVRGREIVRERQYGVTPAMFAAMLASQGGRCAICRADRPYGRGDWHLDHDHATGAPRGVLCSRCNTGIGNLRDDPHIVMAAATYLLKHAAKLKVV